MLSQTDSLALTLFYVDHPFLRNFRYVCLNYLCIHMISSLASKRLAWVIILNPFTVYFANNVTNFGQLSWLNCVCIATFSKDKYFDDFFSAPRFQNALIIDLSGIKDVCSEMLSIIEDVADELLGPGKGCPNSSSHCRLPHSGYTNLLPEQGSYRNKKVTMGRNCHVRFSL